MGLYHTYTSENRVITQPLITTYTRNNVTKAQSKVGAAYLEYTRLRTKQYSYVGMDYDTALSCANAMNLLYQRKIFEWVWDNTSKIWKYDTSPTNRRYKCVSCGTATPTKVGGSMWNVDIQVCEEITIPFRNLIEGQTEELPYPWTAFESNPSMMTDAFKGYVDAVRTDFDYDEGN